MGGGGRRVAARLGGRAVPALRLGIRQARPRHPGPRGSTSRADRRGRLPVRAQSDVPRRAVDGGRRGSAVWRGRATGLRRSAPPRLPLVRGDLRGADPAEEVRRLSRALLRGGAAVASAAASLEGLNRTVATPA